MFSTVIESDSLTLLLAIRHMLFFSHKLSTEKFLKVLKRANFDFAFFTSINPILSEEKKWILYHLHFL
jgi:hypothetical protein